LSELFPSPHCPQVLTSPQGPSKIPIAKEGGADAALKMVEEFLDKEHPGLKKLISDPKEK
jgi:hypothetical protein